MIPEMKVRFIMKEIYSNYFHHERNDFFVSFYFLLYYLCFYEIFICADFVDNIYMTFIIRNKISFLSNRPP